MVKHTKGFKGLSKKVLSAILAASMIMTSSSFVMAEEPQDEVAVEAEAAAVEEANAEETAVEEADAEAETEETAETNELAEVEKAAVQAAKQTAVPEVEAQNAAVARTASSFLGLNPTLGGKQISDLTQIEKFSYADGNEVKPEIHLQDNGSFPAYVLVEGRDYHLTYANCTDVSANVGYATVTIEFDGATYGNVPDVTLKYEIVPYEIKEQNATVYYATEESLKYNGKIQVPEIDRVVIQDGEEYYELGEGDYKIVTLRGAEVSNKNVGTYKVKVVGTGNYTGTIDSEYSYKITPAELSNSTSIVTVDPIAFLSNKSATAVKAEIEDSINVYDGVNDRDLDAYEYTIRYMDEKTGEYTLKMPSADMGVHQMRVYGAENYDSNSYVDATYEIVKENSLQMAVNEAIKADMVTVDGFSSSNGKISATYNGKDKFVDNDEVKISTLSSNQYEIVTERAEWIDAGVYYITVEGKNNFAGDTATIPVMIKSKVLKDNTGFSYTVRQGTHRSGSEGTLEVVVRDEGIDVTLQQDKDYVYTVKTGAYAKKTVVITGIGNYADDVEKNIDVSEKLYLNDSTITAEVTKTYPYSGEEVKPTASDIKLVEKDGNNEYTITDDDFYVKGYRNHVNAGEATVIISAKSDSKYYVGDREITFVITGLAFEDTFEFAPISDTYVGADWNDVLKQIKVEYQSNGAVYGSYNDQKNCKIEILKDGKRVTETELANKDGISEAGEYVVKATPVGSRYSGSLETTFNVKGVDIAQNTTVSDIADYVYTGEAIEPKVTVKNDNKTLVEGEDYTVSYSGNVEGGTAVAIIKGIGNYSGTIEKEFTITQGQQELSMTNPLQERDLENGSRTTKSKVCTLKLGYALEDKNMSLSYDTSDASVATVNDGKITYKGVGECTITVTAKETNNCKADTLEIKVVVGKPGQPTFTPSVTSKTAKKSFVVTSSTIPGADGFEVQYSIRPDWWRATTKDFTNVSAGGKLYRQVLTTYHSNKTYYIRVRAYQVVDGEKVYSDWSPAKTATTK